MTAWSNLGVALQPDLASGTVDFGELTSHGARLRGAIAFASRAVFPRQIIVVVSGEITTRVTLASTSDIEPTPFEADIPIESFRAPLMLDLHVYGQDSTGATVELPLSARLRS